jgi:hypothetical protein
VSRTGTIRRELMIASCAAIAGSTLTTALLMGINSAYAVGPVPSLQTLHERVRKLETRVAADEQERDASAGKTVANRVRAPFVVVDAKDRPIVTIDANGDAHLLRMGALGSGSAIQLQRTADEATLMAQLGSVNNQVLIGVRQSLGPRLEAYTPQNSTIIGAGPNNKHGLFLRDGGGRKGQAPAKVLGELAVTVGESGGILRLHDRNAQQVLSAGSNPKEGGRAQLGIGAPGKATGLVLYTATDGHGELQILGDGKGKPVIELSGSRRHLLLSNRAGTPAAVMRLSQGGSGSGGNFTAVDGGGNNVVSLGAKSGGGGALCAIHPKKGNKCFP